MIQTREGKTNMNRKIRWQSGVFDEIELVYEKAMAEEQLGELLEELEILALSEAKNICGVLAAKTGGSIAQVQFDGLSDNDKETVIRACADMGIGNVDMDIKSATIYICFTPAIQKLLGCTIFNVLNRIEKLDGSINMLYPKWTLELQVPMGGKKGFFQWEMLIAQLYPWLSVTEISTNEVVEEMMSEENLSKAEIKEPKPEETVKQRECIPEKPFWKRLFRK